MKRVLGIDPGFTGACALTNGEWVSTFDMPVKFIRGVKYIDAELMSDYIRVHAKGINYAVIEDVHSMPHDGVSSAFRFGYGTGVVNGILSAHGIRVYKVKPAVWKAAMGLGRNKKDSLVLAKKLFPHSQDFSLLKHDGRAEAAIMAHFGFENL